MCRVPTGFGQNFSQGTPNLLNILPRQVKKTLKYDYKLGTQVAALFQFSHVGFLFSAHPQRGVFKLPPLAPNGNLWMSFMDVGLIRAFW
jgi:hypothetical protein